jgi:hypothetical protein
VNLKVGDIYIRHSDGKIWKVKIIDNIKVVLESQDGSSLSITDIFGLEKGYSQPESTSSQ